MCWRIATNYINPKRNPLHLTAPSLNGSWRFVKFSDERQRSPAELLMAHSLFSLNNLPSDTGELISENGQANCQRSPPPSVLAELHA